MILYPGADNPTDLVARLRRLADSIEAIVAGRGPSEADLADAPILTDWTMTTRPRPTLRGVTVGHPLLTGQRRISTSEVYAISPTSGWALSWSRFYQLGRGAADIGSLQ